jgi:chorismate--pyruvate lyase
VIFSYPKLERMAMDVTVVHPRIMTQLAIDAGNISQPLWGRRTVYAIRHQHLLVSEFFLAAIF